MQMYVQTIYEKKKKRNTSERYPFAGHIHVSCFLCKKRNLNSEREKEREKERERERGVSKYKYVYSTREKIKMQKFVISVSPS